MKQRHPHCIYYTALIFHLMLLKEQDIDINRIKHDVFVETGILLKIKNYS